MKRGRECKASFFPTPKGTKESVDRVPSRAALQEDLIALEDAGMSNCPYAHELRANLQGGAKLEVEALRNGY